MILLTALMSIITASVFGAPENLPLLAAEHGWTAGKTPQAALSVNDLRRLGGALPEPPAVLERKRGEASSDPAVREALAEIPSAWDWRNVEGHNWVSPVRDQNPWGSCAAFSAIASLETLLKRHAGDPNLDVDLSERFLFAYGGGDSAIGWWLSQAADFLKTIGTVPETLCPYEAWDGVPPTDSVTPYLANGGILIQDWRPIIEGYFYKDENTVKQAVMESPVIAWMELYTDFAAYTGGVYDHVREGEVYAGNHFVLLIGWDDAQDAWICKNSWGTAWGEGGFFRIKKSSKGNCFFPGYTYQLIYGETSGARGRVGRDAPAVMPDGASANFKCPVRGLLNHQSPTIEVLLTHQRTSDIFLTLTSPRGISATVLAGRQGIHPDFPGLFLNDGNAWTVTELLTNRDYPGIDLGFNRGCARPDAPMTPLMTGGAVGEWTLSAADNITGEQGSLDAWSLIFLADPAPASADPAHWSRY